MAKSMQKDSHVYNQLLDKLVEGSLSSGSQIVEDDIANELGVSRIPVRHSLAKLVAQGVFLGGKNGRGVWMREYSVEEIRSLYQFREAIECGVIMSAIESATSSDLLKMEAFCSQMAEEVERSDSVRWVQLEAGFHKAMAEASHNERFVNSLTIILVECRYVFRLASSGWEDDGIINEVSLEEKTKVVSEHRKLVDFIRNKDGEAAVQMISRHIRSAAKHVTEMMIHGSMKNNR